MLWIWPEYIGARSRLARITSWTAALVEVMWQQSCGASIRSVRNENGDGHAVAGLDLEPREIDRAAVEPGGRARLEPPQLEAERTQAPREPLRGDVPRATAGGLDLAGVHQGLEEGAGGHDDGAGPGTRRPRGSARPSTRSPSTRIASTISWRSVRFPAVRRSAWRGTGRPSCRTGPRGLCIAGPLPRLSRRNWIAVASVMTPMAPPRASISRTICPFATPPIAGLQLICPTLSQLIVSRAVRTPIRADARAASRPAWPAPTTTTSYS